MRKVFSYALLFLSVFAFMACSKKDNDVTIDRAKLMTNTWRVVSAEFGREDATAEMYNGYRLTLTSDGEYSVVNPMGSPSPTLTMGNVGNWEFNPTQSKIFFDKGTDMQNSVHVVYISNNGDHMEIEWDVELPGKVRTTYRFKMEPAL